MSIYTCNECKDAAFQALNKKVEGKILMDREEAMAMVRALRASWIPLDDQRLIYDLISRIDRELGVG